MFSEVTLPLVRTAALVLGGLRHPFRIQRDDRAYPALLGRLVLLALAYPALVMGDLGSWIWFLTLWMVLIGAVSVCAETPGEKRLAIVLFSMALCAGLVDRAADVLPYVHDDVRPFTMTAQAIGYTLVFALVAKVMARDIFRREQVDTQKIVGSICLYLVLGLAFGHLLVIAEMVTPGVVCFRFTLPPETYVENAPNVIDWQHANWVYAELIYLAFVSLTTLGYGDVVPVHPFARVLTVGAALVGQIYLTVLVARLVGLHIAQSRLDDDSEPG